MKKILITFLFLLAIGGGIGFYMFNKKVPTLEKTKADFELTANELFDEFENDENAALTKYEDKVIDVTGTIISTKENDGTWNVILEAENAMAGGINCSFSKDPGELGKTHTIRGRCQGFLMDVVLNNCTVVK